jgi:hypothetical protein
MTTTKEFESNGFYRVIRRLCRGAGVVDQWVMGESFSRFNFEIQKAGGRWRQEFFLKSPPRQTPIHRRRVNASSQTVIPN